MHHDTVYGCLITHTINAMDGGRYHVWSLPALELLHEVYCHTDTVAFARLVRLMIMHTITLCYHSSFLTSDKHNWPNYGMLNC